MFSNKIIDTCFFTYNCILLPKQGLIMLESFIMNVNLSETMKDTLPLIVSIFCFLFVSSFLAIIHKRNKYNISDFLISIGFTTFLYFTTIKVLGLARLDYIFDGIKYILKAIEVPCFVILTILIQSKILFVLTLITLESISFIMFLVNNFELFIIVLTTLEEEFRNSLEGIKNKIRYSLIKIINLHINLRLANCLFRI